MKVLKSTLAPLVAAALVVGLSPLGSAQAAEKPNILVIMGDDIGITDMELTLKTWA